MLYKSIHNPVTEASGELIVLSYKDRNILIPLFQDYQDIIELAKFTFQLSTSKSQRCVLQTNELNGCDGKWVEIHKDAWTFIRRTLHKIVVEVVPGNELKASDDSKTLKQPSPIPPKHKQASPLPQKQQLLHITPTDPSSSRSTPTGSGRISPSQRPLQSNQPQSASISTPKGKGKTPRRPLPQPFPRKSGVKNANLPQPIPIRTYTIGKDEVAVASPKTEKKRKSPSFRRSEEPEEVPLQASTSQQPKSDGDSEYEDFVETEFTLGTEANETTEDDHHEEKYTEVTEESPRKRPRLSGQDGVRANPNENFIISIECGEPEEEGFQESLFKVKGKHPVQKVLAMACRTFHVENDDAAKAHLVLIMEDEENGEAVEHRFKCDNENSMADEGAYPQARFVVAFGDEDDD
ncbi:hypothetical protein QCA50_005347 [Cerrena zonata]|uniref:Uncharacterized protein n=1 Tax=Cerrena zonata TaxID=2478898 RepID=A0AAW0GH12_9APHY